ncbi:MAG: hypothetical protein V3W20_12570 [Candidatus Neomarinimicrobiota bacterium]
MLIVFGSLILIGTIFMATETFINIYSTSIGSKFCHENGYDEMTLGNLLYIRCTTWYNMTLKGGFLELRDDNYYYKINNTWTLIDIYKQRPDELKRGDVT